MFCKLALATTATAVFISASTITDVVPNANASANGNGTQNLIFSGNTSASTFQWQLAASQLTSLIGDSITAIGFRLPGGASDVGGPIDFSNFDLELSSANNSIGSLDANQANNIGPDVTTVYDDVLTLGPLSGGAGPNPFFLITFTTPYTYTGGDLVLTENASGGSSIALDANAVGDGLGDTSSESFTEYFNYPVTELQGTDGVGTTTPEPGTLLSLAAGLLTLGAIRIRKS